MQNGNKYKSHQDIDEFYDNIIDTLLDDNSITLYIKSFSEILESGTNGCLQCNDIQVKKHMDSYHSIKLPVHALNRSSAVNINTILWCHFASDISKKTWFVANVKAKTLFIK